jgi:hypothetical protein
MSAALWGCIAVQAAALVVPVWMVRREQRNTDAQHTAYRRWTQIGQVVPGWSPRWCWSHPRDEDLAAAGSGVVNVFTTLAYVTQVRLTSLVLGGGGTGGHHRALTGTASVPVRVVPGQVLTPLSASSSRTTPGLVNALGARDRGAS